MLRQNRYKHQDFIQSLQELELKNNEILISKKHDIVIDLESHQAENEKFEEIKPFIMKIIEAIPALDNETQDYFETISNDTDFPNSLSVVCFEKNEVVLGYWCDDVNSQFSVVFCFDDDTWILKKWGMREVSPDWHKSYIKNKSTKKQEEINN